MKSYSYATYTLENYLISYDPNIAAEKYNHDSYYGIIFTMSNGDTYELCHNFHMGNRLLIKNQHGWQDIPFKPSSFGCLPAEIKALEILQEERI
jgi:hypothetical protein